MPLTTKLVAPGEEGLRKRTPGACRVGVSFRVWPSTATNVRKMSPDLPGPE
jgi:hypothetical protein